MRFPTHMDNVINDSLIVNVPVGDDFSDYMWMADEESFDKQVLAELQEEEEMEQCMEEMLAEEEARDTTYFLVNEQNGLAMIIPPGLPIESLVFQSMADINLHDSSDILSISQLNPDAREFVPSRSEHVVSTSVPNSKPSADPSSGKSNGLEAPDR